MIQRYEADEVDVYRRDDGDFIYYADYVASHKITDAQVEAAARMLYVQLSGRKWTEEPDHAERVMQESYRIIARAILEAARAAGGAP